jgi:hypothetical protein
MTSFREAGAGQSKRMEQKSMSARVSDFLYAALAVPGISAKQAEMIPDKAQWRILA